MNAKEAKRLSKIEKDLLKKFKIAEKEEVKRLRKEEKELMEDDSENELEECPKITHIVPEKLTPSSAQKLAKIQNKLQTELTTQYQRDIEEIKQREKKYEPITKAIKEKKEETSKEVIPFVTSTPRPNRAIRFEDEYFSEEEDFSKDETGSPLGLPSTPERESFRHNKSLKQLMDTKTVRLGLIAARYFPRANDKQFGIYYDENDEQVKIGSEPITFENDDIILINRQKKYKGTEGLWRLLTKNDYFDKEGMYTDDDWEAYKEILFATNSFYQRNEPSTNKPKSSGGRKYKGMIKRIWEEYGKRNISGSGLATYTENPIEYKYVSNLNELIKRLTYIQAQETAGNNNFHNEKLALAKFLGDRLEELIETPKGIKYLVRCLSVLPESMIEGKGVLNDIINNLPFELHWPGYSYLGQLGLCCA